MGKITSGKLTNTINLIIFTAIYTIIGYVFPLQQNNPTLSYLMGTSLTGFLYAVLLNQIFNSINIGARGRFFTVWLPLYAIQMFNPLLEGILFTNQFTEPVIVYGVILL